MPVFTNWESRVIGPDVGWPLLPVFLVGGELHLTECRGKYVKKYRGRKTRDGGSTLAFMIYDRGAITLETKGLRAKPYRAAPRRVAVSESAGLAITRIREENCS